MLLKTLIHHLVARAMMTLLKTVGRTIGMYPSISVKDVNFDSYIIDCNKKYISNVAVNVHSKLYDSIHRY